MYKEITNIALLVIVSGFFTIIIIEMLRWAKSWVTDDLEEHTFLLETVYDEADGLPFVFLLYLLIFIVSIICALIWPISIFSSFMVGTAHLIRYILRMKKKIDSLTKEEDEK